MGGVVHRLLPIPTPPNELEDEMRLMVGVILQAGADGSNGGATRM